MNNLFSYKIQAAYMLPYHIVIDKEKMKKYEETNEIIASSRIYLICKLTKPYFLLPIYSRPKVLYVGETFCKESRFNSHSKLLKATTLVKPGDVLAVYFLHIRFTFLGFPIFNTNPLNTMKDLTDLNSKPSVQLLERFLIKLFDPILNSKHTTTSLFEDPLVKTKLMDNQIRYALLDVGMNEKHFQFSGGNVKKGIDLYHYDLTNEKLLEGIPSIFEET